MIFRRKIHSSWVIYVNNNNCMFSVCQLFQMQHLPTVSNTAFTNCFKCSIYQLFQIQHLPTVLNAAFTNCFKCSIYQLFQMQHFKVTWVTQMTYCYGLGSVVVWRASSVNIISRSTGLILTSFGCSICRVRRQGIVYFIPPPLQGEAILG